MIPNELIEKINTYYAESQFDELESFLLDCLNRKALSSPSFQILILNELGTYYRGATRFSEAIHYFQEAIAILKDTVGVSCLLDPRQEWCIGNPGIFPEIPGCGQTASDHWRMDACSRALSGSGL